MAEHHVRKLGQRLLGLGLEGDLVRDHHAGRVFAGIAPGALLHGRAPVPGVVTRHHDETGVHQGGDEVKVAAGVLAEPVD